MGIFDFLKKKTTQKDMAAKSEPDILSGQGMIDYISSNLENPTQENVLKVLDRMAQPDDDLEHLTKDGKLPWGWHSHNKEFTEKINTEYSHFLNTWLDSKNKSPKEQYSALKSFVTYLHDVERLCKSKGECYEFWFYQILASKDYIAKRDQELNELIANFDEEQKKFDKRNNELIGIDSKIVKLLKENPNILQTDFVKLFDSVVQPDVKEKLYYMEKSGELERTKLGRSYILNYKQ